MRDKSEFWAPVASGLGACLLTLLAAWFTIGREAVSAEQVSRMIQTESPYVRDQRVVEQMYLEVKALRQEMTDLSRTVAKIEERTR
jgi:cell division protein FtsB